MAWQKRDQMSGVTCTKQPMPKQFKMTAFLDFVLPQTQQHSSRLTSKPYALTQTCARYLTYDVIAPANADLAQRAAQQQHTHLGEVWRHSDWVSKLFNHGRRPFDKQHRSVVGLIFRYCYGAAFHGLGCELEALQDVKLDKIGCFAMCSIWQCHSVVCLRNTFQASTSLAHSDVISHSKPWRQL